MSFWDALFGRSRPVKSKSEALFAIATGYLTLTTRLNLTPTQKAGVCFRTVASSFFDRAEEELSQVLKSSAEASETRLALRDDSHGFKWVILEDPDFEDLVTLIYMTGQMLEEKGFRDQILAAVFAFQLDGREVFWIYNYKRGKFYPFVPKGQGQERDNARELELKVAMERELPVDPSLENWYALWGIPF